jgi:membrane protein DedA with SNARE-associated domain
VTFLTNLGDQLLAGVMLYGYPILGLTLLLGALGLPVPASLAATVAGALLAAGDLSPSPTLLVALGACIGGDLIGYGVGRLGGTELTRRHGQWLGLRGQRVYQLEMLFRRWAGPTLLLSRSFLAIVAPAVNLLAGASRERLLVFLTYDTIGRAIWVVTFVGLGYAFAGSAETAADLASSLSGLLGLVGLALLVAVVAGGRRRQSVAR